MRSPAAIVAGFAVAATLGLAAAALLNERSQAFTLGVQPGAVTTVRPGKTVCQTPISVPDDAAFDGVTFAVGTEHRPGPRLDVYVRAADTARPGVAHGAVLGRGTLAAGYPDVDQAAEHTVWIGNVPAERSVAVCLANRGARPAFIYGNADVAARSSSAFIDGKPTGSDISLAFDRRMPRSLATLMPSMIERATLFRARFVGPWTYVVVGLLVLLAAPALLARAVTLAVRDQA
jgi:hypothetical protein